MKMKMTRRVLGVVAVAMAVASGADAAVLRLSLDDALRLAHERNTTVKAARARVDQADAAIVQSRQAYLPKVQFSETWVHTNDPGANLVFKLQQGIVTQPDFMPDALNHPDGITDFQSTISVVQPIINVDAMLGRSVASTARKAQSFMADRTVETIDLNVRKAYYGFILARRNLVAVEKSIGIMQGYSNEAAKGYRVGLLTKSDKLSTDVRLAELREQKLSMQEAERNAADALRSLLSLEPGDVIVPTGDFSGDAAGRQAAAGVSGRSDLKALAAYQEVRAYQHDMARAQWLPRLNAFAQQSWHDANLFGGNGSNFTIGVSMQWNLFDGMSTQGKVQEAKAQMLEARYTYEAAKEQGDFELNRARRAMTMSRERLAVAQKSLESARVSLDFIGEQYRTGMAMTFEVLMREQAFTWAKLRINQALYDYSIARSEAEYYGGK